MRKIKNPSIFEINTRVWLKRFNTLEKEARISDVPDSYWTDLALKGIDCIWLMGIWKTCESTIEKYCFEDFLQKNYSKALKDWKPEDVIGSPFAIDVYEINPVIGDTESLLQLKAKLNSMGVRLILDFIPNHFSADTSLLITNPEVFLSVPKEYFDRDPHTYFKPFEESEIYFAHGRDPFFPAWRDTVQVNYFKSEARNFMIDTLKNLTVLCDGVRCDMAMLNLTNTFQNTWGGVLSNNGFEKPEEEFWQIAVSTIKNINPNFLFIAEVYWDLEWRMQQLGFDFTYDKKLTDRLASADIWSIKSHLYAEKAFQERSLRFIENHDEERSIVLFGKEKCKPSAVIISTLPGMHLYFDGQFEGKRIKLPVQLGREPIEQKAECMPTFYSSLLFAIKDDVFKNGNWNLLECESSWPGNTAHGNMFAWHWNLGYESRLVVVNYSDKVATCRIKLDLTGYPEEFKMVDLLNHKIYYRSAEEVNSLDLYVELKSYHSHIFAY
ncbi:MAG: alpha-amylase family glycosyl hydrolase [bacterium]